MIHVPLEHDIVNHTALASNAALVELVPVIFAYVPVDLFFSEYWALFPFFAKVQIILLVGVLVMFEPEMVTLELLNSPLLPL